MKLVQSFVCMNDGKGGFPTSSPPATQSATIIVAADLDGDGKIDLFVPHRDGGQSLIYWNDGTGTFKAPPTKVGSAHSSIRAAAATDLNGDGIVDLVIGGEQTGLFIYLGKEHREAKAPSMAWLSAISMATAGLTSSRRVRTRRMQFGSTVP